MTELITQIFAAMAALIAAWQAFQIERLKKVGKRKDGHITQFGKHFSAISLFIDLELISIISSKVDEIFHNTGVDRFLLLIALNGKESFNVVSVVYERHKIGSEAERIEAIDRYNHVIIDADYKKILKDAEVNGVVLMDVDEMNQDSILYNIYRSEGVTASLVKLISRVNLDSENSLLLYCSFATHDESKISKRDQSLVHTLYGGVKKAFDEYLEKMGY